MNTAWHLTQAWSLYGDFALSALWSQFEVDRKDTRLDEANNGGANNPSLNTSITVVNSSNDFHTLKGVLELGLECAVNGGFSKTAITFLYKQGGKNNFGLIITT